MQKTSASLSLAPDRAVVGVVLEVPEPYGDDIMQWRIGLGDAYADRMPTHITMLLPPPMTPAEVDRLTTALDLLATQWAAFDVTLGSVGSFRPVSPVVYLKASAEQERLQLLQQELMEAHGPFEPAHPFVPHVTVAMGVGEGLLDAAADAMADYQCQWSATALSLFQRHRDGRWQRLSRHRFAVSPPRTAPEGLPG